MPRTMSPSQVASEMQQNLDENDVSGFVDSVQMALAVDADLDAHYGKETGYKTILHLALEEDDGEPYVEELLRAGARADYYNTRVGCSPVHVAALDADPNIFKLLFKFPDNRADVNALDIDEISAFHILLANLIDAANLENKPLESRGTNPPSDHDIEVKMDSVFECLMTVIAQRNFHYPDHALKVAVEKTAKIKSKITMKKLCSMTPLQILCSFQTWNAKPISIVLHKRLEELVKALLSKGVDPNETAAKAALPGTVPGSTPAVFLAATRGYYKVVEAFKKNVNTNFLIENKFKQTILHMVLKAGYYNKIAVHGDESGGHSIKTLECLFEDDSSVVQKLMRGIVNRLDHQGNSALHYAKPYPDQSVAKLLLRHGAKLERNEQKAINVLPRTLEEHFYEFCINTEGEDVDDEEFKIRINFKLFEKPFGEETGDLHVAMAKANAWAMEMEEGQMNKGHKKKNKEPEEKRTGKVDTKRLEHFSDVDSLHYLLKHPVMTSFLEMELKSLKFRYWLDVILYFGFVVVLFLTLSSKYGLSHKTTSLAEHRLYSNDSLDFHLTIPLLILISFLALLIIRELWQLCKLRKRYFETAENYIEWTVIVLVVANILPGSYVKDMGGSTLQRHLAALTLLIAFVQLYLLLVRVVPNTPIPIYINMFTTVLKTYTFILLSYMAFILSFAYSFYLIFGPIFAADGTVQDKRDKMFGSISLSLIKTLVMFIGELDYNDFMFSHWLGYVIFVLFLFLLIIVLMNILNGLAVSDINKIQEEVDTYHHVSIVETLSHTSFVSLLAEEIVISPNIRPENQKIMGLAIPGSKVYRVQGGNINEEKKKAFFLSESTVKSAKDLVGMKLQQRQSMGKVTLDVVRDAISDVRKDNHALRSKLRGLEDNVKMLVEIMASRHPVVDRV